MTAISCFEIRKSNGQIYSISIVIEVKIYSNLIVIRLQNNRYYF